MINQEVMVNKSMSDLASNLDEHIYNALKNSIYPGAKDESIAMILAYCKAKSYDPLAKTCYIVPMHVRDSKTGQSGWRDVVLPGISGYRIDAHRTGAYLGVSEPEFGPMVTEKLGDKMITYPEWCKITVKKKMPGGTVAEFTAKEYWKENYATKGKDSNAPNSMWEKRSLGQLAKCAEAQALRKAFPDAVGNLPTFEEMDGKELKSVFDEQKSNAQKLIEDKGPLDSGQLSVLKDLINEADSDENNICKYLKIEKIEQMNSVQWNGICEMLEKKISQKRKNQSLAINQIIHEEPKVSDAAAEFDKEYAE